MKNNNDMGMEVQTTTVITPEEMLKHWQGHRRVTRRIIEAFPENELFNYSVGGMRPFAELAMEMVRMAAPGISGIATGDWFIPDEAVPATALPATKAELLAIWDNVTAKIDRLWQEIPAGRFQQFDTAFGQYPGPVWTTLFYFIDNEIHHRGQGYVYLRSLGVEPPAFWDRT